MPSYKYLILNEKYLLNGLGVNFSDSMFSQSVKFFTKPKNAVAGNGLLK